MTTTIRYSTAIVLALAIVLMTLGIGVQQTFAAEAYAASVESFTQGNQKDGDPVDVSRSDPTKALGLEDSVFVSLGYDGELVLDFGQDMNGSLTLTVFETTNGSYPLETADVYVKRNLGDIWTFVGSADNDGGTGNGQSVLNPQQCFQYVRIVDTTDESLHNNNSDGFDVDAVKSEFDGDCPEPEQPQTIGDDRVRNSNSGAVINNTSATANTGGNWAGGADGGNAGDGGSAVNAGNDDGATANGGKGGNGGNGGNAGAGSGGQVVTGNATAGAGTVNVVNSNVTRIDRCACSGGDDEGDVSVRNRNGALLLNNTNADANTGDNGASGADGGAGGEGGFAGNFGNDSDPATANGGNGGNGGAAGEGGTVWTGNAGAVSGTLNVVNRNRTTIRR